MQFRPYAIFIFQTQKGFLEQNTAVSNSDAQGLTALGISLSFGEFQVLRSVNFQLKPGRIHAITGENGAGKSSLGKIIAGLYKPTTGTVALDGHPLHLNSPREGLAHGIALIHQEPLTFPDLSIAENILAGNLPVRGGRVDWNEANRKSAELLSQLGSLLDVKQTAGTLSIADQQLLELAAALAHDAKVWIFDETTAPLTPTEAEGLFKIMRTLRDKGCCIAFVSHHLDEVFGIADEITVLRGGELVAHLQTSDTTKTEVVRHMVGRSIDPTEHTYREPATEVALAIGDLSGPGFQNVSFCVRKGEIFGISGLIGAGRTEVARALFGITKSTQGAAELFGKPYSPSSPKEAIDFGVQLVPEDRRGAGLMIERSILDNASLVQVKTFANSLGLINLKSQQSAIFPILEQLKTAMRSTQQPVGQLSGGNQQKVVLTKSLLKTPRLIIFDEPTRGVDIGAKFDVHQLIRDLADSGVAIILISSDLPEVLNLSDRIGVMRRGTIVGTLARAEATQEKIIALASGGQI